MSGSILCKVCRHSARKQIEILMLEGVGTRQIEKKYGMGRMSVQRHREQHLEESLRRDVATAAISAGEEPNLVDKLTAMERRAKRMSIKAERAGQYTSAVAAMREERSIAEYKARIRGEVVEPPTVREGDTFNIWAGDAEAGVRMARMYIERQRPAALPEPAINTDVVEPPKPDQGDE